MRRGRIMSDGLRVWKRQVRVAREPVAEEARYLGQAVKRMVHRKLFGPNGMGVLGHRAVEPQWMVIRDMRGTVRQAEDRLKLNDRGCSWGV